MVDIANFLAQNSPRFNRADQDMRHYQNALVQNDVQRIPQANRIQDLNIQGAEQNLSTSRMQNARQLAQGIFTAIADSPDPIATGSMLTQSEVFRTVGGELKLPVDQFRPAPGDNPEQIRAAARAWAQAVGAQVQGADGFTLGDGQTRFDASGRQIASVAPKSPDAGGFTLGDGQTRFNADGTPIANVPKAPAAPPAGQGFDQAAKLRGEFNSQTANFRTASEGYRSVLAAARNPSAAGDLALIFSFMRTLDPSSSVREGEFANAQNAGGVPDRVRAQYNSILNGQRLSVEQRQDFVSQATNLYDGQKRGYDTLAAKYTDLATRAQLNPLDVIGLSTAVETGGGDINALLDKYAPAHR